MSTIPMGFVLVVGFGVALIAVLQVLAFAWLVDTARSVRAMTQVLTAQQRPAQVSEPQVAEQPVGRPQVEPVAAETAA
jgi:hypothetical protein